MNRFTKSLAEADAAFSGQYFKELELLKGLSEDEISKISPNTTTMSVYEKLIEIVENASRKNMAQAELVSKIKGLGDTAIKISKKIPGLASLF